MFGVIFYLTNVSYNVNTSGFNHSGELKRMTI